MATARCQGAHHEVEGAHRQGAGAYPRTGGHGRAGAQRVRQDRFLCHRSQDQAPDRNAEGELSNRRTYAVRDLDFIVTAGMRVGLVGPNGSGKTTLLRLLRGDLPPSTGEIRRADSLRIVHFDQNREIDPTLTLARALAPDSDSVVYGERVIHVASWAARFLVHRRTTQPAGVAAFRWRTRPDSHREADA